METGTSARGARWADAEVTDSDDLRTHLDTLDRLPRDRSSAAADRPVCSLASEMSDRTEGRVMPGSCSRCVYHSAHSSTGSTVPSVCLGFARSVSSSQVHSSHICAVRAVHDIERRKDVSSELPRSSRISNIGRPHNRGTASVVGVRRMSARTCLLPSLCRPCGRPNSCGVASAPTFARLAPDPSPASVAGGALAVVEHAHHGTHNCRCMHT